MPRRRLLVLILLGFASGLPLFLTGSTLKLWLTDEGLSLGTIGLFSFVTLPYSLKVFWAPFLDRYALPGLGRRRGWMMLMQLGMAVALFQLARSQPRLDLYRVAWLSLAVAITKSKCPSPL